MLVNEIINEGFNKANVIRDVAKELNIPFAIAMELSNKESSQGQFDKDGNTIVGDKKLKNKAYGMAQVRLPALKDVNRLYGTNYSLDDIKNDANINAKVGLLYFKAQGDFYGAKDYIEQLRGYNGGPSAIKGDVASANSYANDIFDKAVLNYNGEDSLENFGLNEATPWELLKRKITPVVQKNKYQRVAEKLHAMLLRKQKENGGIFRHALGWYTYNIGNSYRDIDHKVLHQYYLDNFDAVVD